MHAKNVIHNDLVERNASTSKLVGFVADFGLSRVLPSGKDVGVFEEGVPLPVKQLAPEIWLEGTLKQKWTFSKASDVFAFGILIWELFAQIQPYPNADGLSAVKAVCT